MSCVPRHCVLTLSKHVRRSAEVGLAVGKLVGTCVTATVGEAEGGNVGAAVGNWV